jgi:hypothetical protein
MAGGFVRGDMMAAMRWVLTLALLAGCGPFAYVNQVPTDAARKVEAARKLEAAKYSPYWWTRATQYLHMAREVAAHADYQGANRFGRLASEAAQKAADEAEIAAKDPSKRPVNPTKELAPAKDKDKPDVAPAKEEPKKDEAAPAKDKP